MNTSGSGLGSAPMSFKTSCSRPISGVRDHLHSQGIECECARFPGGNDHVCWRG